MESIHKIVIITIVKNPIFWSDHYNLNITNINDGELTV